MANCKPQGKATDRGAGLDNRFVFNPHVIIKPEPKSRPNRLHPQNQRIRAEEPDESFTESFSVHNTMLEQHLGACEGEPGCGYDTVSKGYEGSKVDESEVQEDTGKPSLIDRSLHPSQSKHRESQAPQVFNYCVKWDN